MLRKPYLLFLGDAQDPLEAKTAFGLRDWCPADAVGQFRLPECRVDLGLPDLGFVAAAERGVGSVVIGVAPVGGQLQERWVAALAAAARAGLDVVSGLHSRLSHYPALVEASQHSNARLVDVRNSASCTSVGTGERRSGNRVLTVGTDCALGKKYTALSICRALQARGHKATFRATGQTGILISGSGVPIDAVVADFLSGAAEALSPAADDDHWDVIEGQGSLFHPAYAGVTLGLIHGSQPDAMILCHDPRRLHIDGYPNHPIPNLQDAVRRYEEAARLTNPCARVTGLSFNTSGMPDADARASLDEASERVGLPATDPLRFGVGLLVEAVLT